MRIGVARRAATVVVAAASSRAVRGLLDGAVPGGQRRWLRTNHRGEPVSLLAGPATAAGLLAGGIVGAPTTRGALATVIATATGAGFGLVDDLREDAADRAKGLRGHLGALAHGRLTTGGLKVIGIGAGALLAAAVATPVRRADGSRRSTVGWLTDVATSGALISASANLVNLLDLRPGRALKAVGLAALPLALGGREGSGVAASVVGVAWAGLDADLEERDMLGDGGANALGAALGAGVVLDAPRSVRLALLAGAVGLTLASERISFTEVIAATPVLRELDAWGRRPARPTGGRAT
jgi:UDP-N-acetylmuramyl pentapeptide phosphotransferase/UDP-N-acetylglucosamine-1-phosphate transferase